MSGNEVTGRCFEELPELLPVHLLRHCDNYNGIDMVQGPIQRTEVRRDVVRRKVDRVPLTLHGVYSALYELSQYWVWHKALSVVKST
jgi:hypothetical protein